MILFDGIHLASDESLDELHAFAKSVGLKREWFQDHPRHPHYDVWGTPARSLAVNVTSRELVRLARKCRTGITLKDIEALRGDLKNHGIPPDPDEPSDKYVQPGILLYMYEAGLLDLPDLQNQEE